MRVQQEPHALMLGTVAYWLMATISSYCPAYHVHVLSCVLLCAVHFQVEAACGQLEQQLKGVYDKLYEESNVIRCKYDPMLEAVYLYIPKPSSVSGGMVAGCASDQPEVW